VFLSKRVAEGNPLLVWALPYAPAPWMGLIAAKFVAAGIGLYCYRKGRMKTLHIANAGYFLIVGWNLTAIAAASAVL
jgi:hypothetical protein